MHSTSNMSTKQDIIRHDDTLLKDKKDREDTPTSEVCVSPPSPNSTDKKASCNIVNLTTGKKKRCFNDGCNKKTSKIIGDCNYCNNKFCDKHRLPELHHCQNMCLVKNKSKQILEDRLFKEKCIGEKVIKF